MLVRSIFKYVNPPHPPKKPNTIPTNKFHLCPPPPLFQKNKNKTATTKKYTKK